MIFWKSTEIAQLMYKKKLRVRRTRDISLSIYTM